MKKIVSIPLALFAGIIVIQAASGGGSDETTVAKPAAVEAPAADAAAPAEAPAAEAPAPADPAPAPALAVSAQELIDVLEGNALNAKNTYKDKRVTATGFVGSIDASGDYFSLLPEPDAMVFTGVQVYTDEKFLDQVASFTEGQAVTVTGTITDVGEIMGYSLEAETIQ